LTALNITLNSLCNVLYVIDVNIFLTGSLKQTVWNIRFRAYISHYWLWCLCNSISEYDLP